MGSPGFRQLGFSVGFRGSSYTHTWPDQEADGAGAKSGFMRPFYKKDNKEKAKMLCLLTRLIYRVIIVTLVHVSSLPNERQRLRLDPAGTFT